jgi:hypothetical protein
MRAEAPIVASPSVGNTGLVTLAFEEP